MNKNILILSLIPLLAITSPTFAQEEENTNYHQRINQDEDTLLGKFAEEAAKLEHGAEKALREEWARDKKIFTKKTPPSTQAHKEAPPIESIEADLEAREEIAAEIEKK